MNRYSSLATLALLITPLPLAACEEVAAPELATDGAPVHASADAPDAFSRWADKVTLPLGSTTVVRGERRITFDALGRDGRCPMGVDCVRAGEIAAHFTLDTNRDAFPITFVLPGGHPKGLSLHEAPWASVDGLLVYLVRVDPYPVAHDGGNDDWEVIERSDAEASRPVLPAATLVVRPCPGSVDRCAGSSGGGSADA